MLILIKKTYQEKPLFVSESLELIIDMLKIITNLTSIDYDNKLPIVITDFTNQNTQYIIDKISVLK